MRPYDGRVLQICGEQWGRVSTTVSTREVGGERTERRRVNSNAAAVEEIDQPPVSVAAPVPVPATSPCLPRTFLVRYGAIGATFTPRVTVL